MLSTIGEVITDILTMFSYGLLHMDKPVLANQQGFTYISSLYGGVRSVMVTVLKKWT